MKIIWRGAALALLVVGALLLYRRQMDKYENPHGIREVPKDTYVYIPPDTNAPKVNTVAPKPAPRLAMRAADIAAEERAKIDAKFKAKMKPALAVWCKAYEGHVGFNPDNLTADKLADKFGNERFTLYSYVVDGTTVAFQEVDGNASVNYVASSEVKKLSSLPKGDAPPVMKSPVTVEEVIKMVKADSGTEFKPNDITIRPTGAACVVNGGAFVDVAPIGGPENGLCKYSLVFGPDGNLMYYLK